MQLNYYTAKLYKKGAAPKRARVKKDVKSKVGGQDMASMMLRETILNDEYDH